jgi:hypothetical protein
MRLAQKARKIIGVTSTFVGVAMMVFGIYRGEMAVVLAKAVKVCLECIGIG